MYFSSRYTRTPRICVCLAFAFLDAVLLTGCSLKTNPALAKIQRVAVVEFVASSTDNVPCAEIGPLAHESLESLTKNSQNPPLEFLPVEAVALSTSYRTNSPPLSAGNCSAHQKLQHFDPAIGEARIQALASALHVSGLMTVSTRYSLQWGEGGASMKLEANSQVKLFEVSAR